MMGKVTRDAEQHLLPLSSAAATFVEAVKDWHKSRTAENKSELTFRLVMLNFRISYMADAIGGFYFRLRSAETLASACWHAYRARQHSVLNKQDPLERVLQFMGPKTTGGAFATKRTGVWKGSVGFQNDVNDVESTLAAFVDRPDFPLYELELLRVFQRVIDVEVDRAFSRWYGQEPRVDRQDLRNVRRDSEPSARGGEIGSGSTMRPFLTAFPLPMRLVSVPLCLIRTRPNLSQTSKMLAMTPAELPFARKGRTCSSP
jgi:hypothetical protein